MGGFLGSQIARSLASVEGGRAAADPQRGAPDLGPESVCRPPEVVSANLLARQQLADLVRGVDVIVHAAAGMKGAGPDMVLNTVVATRNLIEGGAVRRGTPTGSG